MEEGEKAAGRWESRWGGEARKEEHPRPWKQVRTPQTCGANTPNSLEKGYKTLLTIRKNWGVLSICTIIFFLSLFHPA